MQTSEHDRHAGLEIDARTRLNSALVPNEAYWTRRLAELDAATLPYLGPEALPCVDPAEATSAPLFRDAVSTLPPEFAESFAGVGAAEAVVCAWAAWLARVGDKLSFDVAFSDPRQAVGLAGHDAWVERYVPLRLDVDPSEALIGVVARNIPRFAEVRKRRSYPKDLVGRTPELSQVPGLAAGRHLPVLVELIERNRPERGDDQSSESRRPAPGAALRLSIALGAGLLRWSYDAARVPAAVFETILAQFDLFLRRLAKHPADRVGDVELLSGEERHRQLVEWNSASADYPRWATVHALFARQAAETPDAVAVTFENRSLTYARLDELSERLAVHLRALGVGPDRLVGIHLKRSEQLVVALLGVLKAGGAYLPLDPHDSHDRIAFILGDSGAELIITERETADRLPPHTAQLIRIDDDWPLIERTLALGGVASQPHHLAYCIYTSDSTDRPSGVLIEHRNVVNFFAGIDAHVDRDAGRTWMAVAGLSFDIHVLELLWTLCRGFHVVVYRGPDISESPAALMLRHGVTHFQCGPSQARTMAGDYEARAALLGLENLFVGGEALPLDLAGELRSLVGGKLLNLYGPLETTVGSSAHVVGREAGSEVGSASGPIPIGNPAPIGNRVPIGRPLANQRLYILDARRRPIPVGVPGELYIGGDGVARGYLNRPDLSTERFVDDPFVSTSGTKMYRTGDRVRYRADGTIELLGRADHQAKPADRPIEAPLAAHDADLHSPVCEK